MTKQLDWSDIAVYGVCVNVKSRVWPGRRRLAPGDIGLKVSPEEWDKMKDKFSLGVKYIIDPKLINPFTALVQRARKVLENKGTKFLGISSVFFVPDYSFVQLQEELNKIMDEFEEEKVKFLDGYDKNVKKWLDNYKDYAVNNLYPRFGNKEMSPETFANNFIRRLSGLVPPKSVVAEKFNLFWSVFEVSQPSEVKGGDLAKIRAREEITKHARKQVEGQVKEFIENVFVSLRDEIVESVGKMSDTLSDPKKNFTNKSLNSVKAKIEKIKALNFLGDEKLSSSLDKLQTMCETSSKAYKDDQKAMSALKSALLGIKDDLSSSLDEEAKSFSSSFGKKKKRAMIV